jgi:hypothetical protein
LPIYSFEADELVTIEKPEKALHRAQSVAIVTIREQYHSFGFSKVHSSNTLLRLKKGKAMTESPSFSSLQDQRVIRVFVSFTFRDMHAERDELILRIFPNLRRLCENRGEVINR